jgi:Mg2+-importing ATPase
MDVLCTDKTGTLTEEGLHFEKYVDLDRADSHNVFTYAFLCNSAVGIAKVRGNALDSAIRRTGLQKGIDVSGFKKLEEIPFDYSRRRMGQVVKEGAHRYLIVKGAPESVLAQCSHVRMGGKLYLASRKRLEVRKMIEGYHNEGFSSLAVAYKKIGEKKSYSPRDEGGLVFLGFVLFSNPPKSTVHATLARLKSLGVRPILLTGDDAIVTRRLCEKVGFPLLGGRVVLGSELSNMTPEKLSISVETYSAFARLTPDQKLSVIEALRANGHVVGFMGDGINDAPSLRSADVGISVDSAADVAKGASHIILLRKSLGAVADGVQEGRRIFANITKYILNTMSANQGNMITIALSSIFLPILPMLPSQILLNNILSDIPLLTVASDKVDESTLRKPQRWNMKFILKFMLFFGLISTVFDLLFICIMAFALHTPTDEFRTAWFLESVLSEMLIVFSLRTRLPFFKSAPSLLLAAATLGAMLLSVAFIYYSPLAELFRFVPISPQLLLLTAGVLVAYFASCEMGKPFFYSKIAPEKEEGKKK